MQTPSNTFHNLHTTHTHLPTYTFYWNRTKGNLKQETLQRIQKHLYYVILYDIFVLRIIDGYALRC